MPGGGDELGLADGVEPVLQVVAGGMLQFEVRELQSGVWQSGGWQLWGMPLDE